MSIAAAYALSPERRHECRRGTHECVRHGDLGLLTQLFTDRPLDAEWGA
jgi:hypothetical protein